MAMMSRDERKRKGIGRFINSINYSMAGLRYAYKNEQSMTIHVSITAVIIIFGIVLHISRLEWVICIFLLGIIMATELINTALEAVVDLITQDYHPLAKIAKDTASAAVFVFSFVAAIIGGLIFIPHIIDLFL